MKKKSLVILEKKIFQGVFLLVIKDFGLKTLNIAGQLILVHLMLPDYFGTFAIISFIISVAELFSDIGLTKAIIQEKKELNKITLSTIFYVKFFLSILVFFGIIISFPLIKKFYIQLTFQNFLMVLTLGSIIIIRSFKNIILALLDRDLNYSAISKVDLLGTLVYVCTAVVLAFLKVYLWNFIYAIIFSEIIQTVTAFYFIPFIPLFKFEPSSIKKMIKFGSFIQIGNVIHLAEESIIPIAGFNLNAYKIGLLDWSSSVTNLSNSIFDNFGRVSFAGMSKIQNDQVTLSILVNKYIKGLNTFSFVFILMVFGFSREFTILFLSSKWIPAIPSLYFFSSSLLFFGASLVLSHALLANGKSKEVTILSGVVVVTEVVLAILILSKVGYIGIAVAVLISSFLQFIVYYLLGLKAKIILSLKEVFFNKLIVYFLSIIVVFILNKLFYNPLPLSLIIKMLLTLVLYVLFMFICVKEEIIDILGVLRIIISNRERLA